MQFGQLKRRDFITLLGGAAAWPLAARAQRAMPVIGILVGGSAESFAPFEPVFRKGLSEGGFPDGSDVPFETRRANGQVDGLPALAADLVSRRPTVIATPPGSRQIGQWRLFRQMLGAHRWRP
jgi:hypothetical protein